MTEQASFEKSTEDSTYVNLPYKQPERKKKQTCDYLIRDRKVLTNQIIKDLKRLGIQEPGLNIIKADNKPQSTNNNKNKNNPS